MTDQMRLDMLRERLQPAMDKLALQRAGIVEVPEISEKTLEKMRIIVGADEIIDRVLYGKREKRQGRAEVVA